MKQTMKSGSLIAAAVASLLLSSTFVPVAQAASASASTGDVVHCAGINGCKGQSDCKSAENACKGQNTCKGHGFKAVSSAECSAKGGKVINAK